MASVRSAALNPPPAVVRVQTRRGVASFLKLSEEWEALATRVGAPLFSRHEFLSLYLRHFAESEPWILEGRGLDGRLTAVLPLLRTPVRELGMEVRALHSASNKHTCRFDLLADDPEGAAGIFLDSLTSTGDFDLLRLADVPEGAAAEALLRAARWRGMPVGSWTSARAPFVALPKTAAEWKALRGQHDKPLRRRLRRLEELGAVEVECFVGGPELNDRLAEAFALEMSGWKGREGTSILQDRRTLRFYTELAEAAACAGTLAVYFLRLDGRAIAFQFGVVDGSRYRALKTGYDESFAMHSPGNLLTGALVQGCIARGLSEVDLLGDENPQKAHWATGVREHHFLYLYANTARGRALHAARFRVRPAVRTLISRSRKLKAEARSRYDAWRRGAPVEGASGAGWAPGEA